MAKPLFLSLENSRKVCLEGDRFFLRAQAVPDNRRALNPLAKGGSPIEHNSRSRGPATDDFSLCQWPSPSSKPRTARARAVNWSGEAVTLMASPTISVDTYDKLLRAGFSDEAIQRLVMTHQSGNAVAIEAGLTMLCRRWGHCCVGRTVDGARSYLGSQPKGKRARAIQERMWKRFKSFRQLFGYDEDKQQ